MRHHQGKKWDEHPTNCYTGGWSMPCNGARQRSLPWRIKTILNDVWFPIGAWHWTGVQRAWWTSMVLHRSRQSLFHFCSEDPDKRSKYPSINFPYHWGIKHCHNGCWVVQQLFHWWWMDWMTVMIRKTNMARVMWWYCQGWTKMPTPMRSRQEGGWSWLKCFVVVEREIRNYMILWDE